MKRHCLNGMTCGLVERLQSGFCVYFQIQLWMRWLPPLPSGAKYQCVFGSAPPVDAAATVRGLRCRAPSVTHRPRLPALADHLTVPLSVRSSETKKDFVTRQFVYFDCGRHAVCGACVASRWGCSWCVYDSKCVSNSSKCHRDSISNTDGQVSDVVVDVVVTPHPSQA